jgi:hypothetical protein
MKKITDSEIFKQIIANGKVVSSIKEVHIQRDKVDLGKLDEPLNVISRRVNFGTKSKVVQSLKSGDVVFIHNPIIDLPKYLNTFGKAGSGGKVVSLVDIQHYVRTNKETEMYDMYPKTMFALAQNGMILNELINNWNRYTTNMVILKQGAIVYSKMVGKIMDKLFAINIDEFKQDLINFLLAKFFLIGMCDKVDGDTIDNIAYNACFNRSSLKLIKEEEGKLVDEDTFTNVFSLFNSMKEIKGMHSLGIRSFVENWARMYGEASLLALDYLPSFLSVIFGSVVNGNITKDFIIESVAGKFINNIYTEFSKLLR